MRPDDNVCPPRGTPNCFCGLPASPAYSEEFGLLYECHYLHNNPWKEVTEEQSVETEAVDGRRSPESDQSDSSGSTTNVLSSSARQIDKPKKAVCGYHIHKDAWDSFFYSKHINRSHRELAICPFFNFTFCAFFNLRNSYPLSHPPPPNCFCGLPVMLRHMINRAELMFTCPNYLIDGARPKCTWKLWANEVPFQRPNGCTHPLQKQGTTRLLDPSRQVQNFNRSIARKGTFDSHNSFSRGRFENNNNNNGRFRSYQQRRFNEDKYSSCKRNFNHSSEILDRQRRDDFGPRDHGLQYQQATSSNENSSVSRRSSGTGWDPGRRNNIKGCKYPTWLDNNNLNNTNINNSTDRQSIEYNKTLNVNENHVDSKESLKMENGQLNKEKPDNISNSKENQRLKPSEMVNNSDRENPNARKYGFDKSVKNYSIEDSVLVGNTSQASINSSPRSDNRKIYNEGNSSSTFSNGTNSSKLSMDDHADESSYISTFNEFSQTKPACIANVAANCNFAAETSRLRLENEKLIFENQSLISKQENDQAEKSNLVKQVEQLKNEVNYLHSKVGHYQSEYVSEQKFRQSSQKKLIELQAQVADVMKEIDELRSSKEKEKEESAMGNMKCKVCFEETITHALLPCHHLALCSKCSQVITKCVICRKPKVDVVRIYLG